MSSHRPLNYTYAHAVTEATTGYFSCEPDPELLLDEVLARLEAAPMDEFMRRHALRRLGGTSEDELRALAEKAGGRPVVRALLQECAVLHPDLADLRDAEAARELLEHTPLPYLRWSLRDDKDLHMAWSRAFAANIIGHHKLPHPEEEDLPPLYGPADMPGIPEGTPALAELRRDMLRRPAPPQDRPPTQETAARALAALVDNGVVAGVEMRHEASLSPVALLRGWRLDATVRCGALDYTLRGEAATYGRGLCVADARASYAMEMVERASAYASVEDGRIIGTMRSMPLFRARLSELRAEGRAALDPGLLPLEAPYADQPLYWLEAEEAGSGDRVLVPAQAVYLFCNLDEPALFMASGSTGLASGNTLDEAKAAALAEVLERDAEAVMPYDRGRCFTLRSADARTQALLDDYANKGIHVHFMDITTEFGVPCCQCFVIGNDGRVHRATGANLRGAKAVMAALTEVPYPYPHGPASAQPLPGLPQRTLEDLPDYGMESPARQTRLLEKILLAHGRRPLYVDLTREDLEFPVVRAIVPGLEMNPEPDRFSRIPPRLYANYLRLFHQR